jgi:DNA-binding transcriptional LysR family regulator
MPASDSSFDQRAGAASVSFKTLELNLLKVFDAVMEERSVLRASQRVAISQSAVSHSLARLREMLEDDLFIRTASGMQPTSRALTMAPLVREALRSLEAAVELPKFEPANSTKQFTLAANDFTTMVLASPLLAILRREAPSIDLVIKPVTRIDLAEQIDFGASMSPAASSRHHPTAFDQVSCSRTTTSSSSEEIANWISLTTRL